MTVDELSQTINKSIAELGFARIARPALTDIFSSGKASGFDIHENLETFAKNQNLEMANDVDEDFVVFSPAGAAKK